MRRGDQKFKNIENKYCCSEHFLPSDYRIGLTGHKKDLKRGAIPSFFPWFSDKSHVKEERLRLRTAKTSHKEMKRSAESSLSDELRDSVNFIGPPVIEQFPEAKRLEVEILKKNFLKQKRKSMFSPLVLKASQKTQLTSTSMLGFQTVEHLKHFGIVENQAHPF